MLASVFGGQLGEAFLLIVPVLVFTAIAAVLTSGLTGGYLFSLKAVAPKASKLNLFAGLKRIFGTHALVELGKALLKFSLVTAVLWMSVMSNLGTLMQIGRMGLEPALHAAGGVAALSAVLNEAPHLRDAVAAILQQDKSYAAKLLGAQSVTRLDVLDFISHGVSKLQRPPEEQAIPSASGSGGEEGGYSRESSGGGYSRPAAPAQRPAAAPAARPAPAPSGFDDMDDDIPF